MSAIIAPLLVASSLASAAPGVGEVPPERVGTMLDGQPALIAVGTGRATVVSFWATWCPYCLKELPILANIQKAVGKERMQVVAVNVEARDVFRRVTRALAPLEIELAYDPDHASRTAFGVGGIPHMVVVGRDGKIVQVFTGYSEESLDSIAAAINRATGAAQ